MDRDCGTVEGIASVSEWLGQQKLHAVGLEDCSEDIPSPFLSWEISFSPTLKC